MTGELPRVAFVGFGALAFELASGMRGAGVERLSVFARPRADAVGAEALRRRVADAGAEGCASIEEAVTGADLVIGAVPAAAAREVAEACAGAIGAGCLYVDPAPLAPEAKMAAAELLDAASASYVDAAVLGTVEADGFRVPILVAGPGARRFAELAVPLGMQVSVVDGPPGQASLVKLLRSVYMKGRDALILEMLLAARRHGLERRVIESIRGAGEQVPFPDLAARVIGSLALYAGRRSDELAASADVLAASGVEPIVTSAGAERLRLLADLDLAERFHGERPSDLEEVLALVEELLEGRRKER
jgi:3-hydroxyisobutyrate dehydrogenase-like beta-hydroxyacid dehydrogenase